MTGINNAVAFELDRERVHERALLTAAFASGNTDGVGHCDECDAEGGALFRIAGGVYCGTVCAMAVLRRKRRSPFLDEWGDAVVLEAKVVEIYREAYLRGVCWSCGAKVADRRYTVCENDGPGWAKLAAEHNPGCGWIFLRAFQSCTDPLDEWQQRAIKEGIKP